MSFVLDGTDLTLWTNYAGGDNTREGRLYRHHGELNSLGPPVIVVDIPDAFLRTFNLVQTTQCCFVLARVGTAYGQSSYYPWFGRSPDCTNWTWTEKLWLGNSNSNTLNVDLTAPSVVDHDNPRHNRFTALDDSLGNWWTLVYSADGDHWYSYPNQQPPRELFPPDIAVTPQFTAEVRTPYGWHAIACEWGGIQCIKHIHLWSANGIDYCVLENNAPTFSDPKGTSLYYEATTNLVHAISGTGGRHLSFPAKAFTCP